MSIRQRIAGYLLDFIDSHRAMREHMTLPKRVQKRRLELREWMEKEARPLIDGIDAAPHSEDTLKWELARRGAKMGLFTMLLPSGVGGQGRMIDFFLYKNFILMSFCEELGSISPGLATLFGAHYLGAGPIMFSMDMALGKRLFKPIIDAEKTDHPKMCAFAITEPGAGSDVEDNEGGEKAHLVTFAKKVAGGYVLNGRKQFISDGSMASLVTVFASLDRDKGIHAWTCFGVTSDMKGFSVGRVEDKMGQRASPAAELIFEDVFVPEDNRVGRENDGWKLNTLTLDLSRGPVGAIGLGGARGALKIAIEYVRDHGLLHDRSIQMELADMLGKYEAARSLLWRACGTFPPLHYLSAMAKVFCSDTAMDICSRTIDLLGEEGTLRQREAERLYRDVKLTQIYEGTNQVNRLAVAEELLPVGGKDIL